MSQLRNRLSARSLFFAVVLLGGYAWLMAGVPFVVNQNAAATGEQGFAELKLNKPVRGELPVGASHRFQITLEAGTFVFFEVVSTGQAAEFEQQDWTARPAWPMRPQRWWGAARCW